MVVVLVEDDDEVLRSRAGGLEVELEGAGASAGADAVEAVAGAAGVGAGARGAAIEVKASGEAVSAGVAVATTAAEVVVLWLTATLAALEELESAALLRARSRVMAGSSVEAPVPAAALLSLLNAISTGSLAGLVSGKRVKSDSNSGAPKSPTVLAPKSW